MFKGTWYTWSQNTLGFFLRFVSKIWMILFWPRVHRWERWSQSGKTLPGGRAEIKNVKYAKSDIFHFNSATMWTFELLHCPKKESFRFLINWVLTNFTEILLHIYQVSLRRYRAKHIVKNERKLINLLLKSVLVLKYGESNAMRSALNTWHMPQTVR